MDAAARLIRAGHRHTDLLGYTLAQVKAYLVADARLEREALSNQLTVMTIAAQGGRDSIRRLQDELRQGSHE